MLCLPAAATASWCCPQAGAAALASCSSVNKMHQTRQLDRTPFLCICRTSSKRQASCSVWAPWMRMTRMLLAMRMKTKTKNPQKLQMQTSLPMLSARQELLEFS